MGGGTNRRDFLRVAAAGAGLGGCSPGQGASDRWSEHARSAAPHDAPAPAGPADVTVRIAPVLVELAPREVVPVNGRATAGVMEDTVVLPGYGQVGVDFVANNPGDTLFHCHQALHMDYGFMRPFRYASAVT